MGRGGGLTQLLVNIPSKAKCKECASAACDNDSTSCHKCKKLYHWHHCSGLSDYNIKLHKNNPYKPCWCGPCIDKYCFQCSKTFKDDNLDSICCDRCSFWYHRECSQLSEDEFDHTVIQVKTGPVYHVKGKLVSGVI